MSEFSRETLLNIIETDHVQCGEASALARMALAAMDSEPVIIVGDDGGDALSYRRLIQSFEPGTKLYLHAHPAPELAAIVERLNLSGYEYEGGEVTPQNAAAIVDTLLQHLDDAVQGRNAHPAKTVQPVMFIDGDISTEDADKLAKVIREFNEEDERPLAKMARIIRENPHPTNECDMPKAQPAPVVPDEATPDSIEILASGRCRDHVVYQWDEDQRNAAADSWNACRDAMLAAGPQSPGSEPATVSGKWIPVSERMPEDDDFVYIWPRPDFGVELHVGQYCERSHKGGGWYAQVYEQNYGIEWYPITVTHWMPLPAAPQEVKDAHH